MRTISTLLKLSRPRFWLYLAGTYAIGFTAVTTSLDSLFTWDFGKFFLFFLIPANIFIYGINDLFDLDTDKLNEKKYKQEIRINKQNKSLYICATFVSFICAITVINYEVNRVWQLMGLFLLLGFFYSAPPLRFKSKPLLDSASNILYGIPGLIGYAQQTNELPEFSIIVAIFCWTFAMHLFSAIPDIKPDSTAGINTTATWLGERNSLYICTGMWLLSGFIAISFSHFFVISFIYPLIPILLVFFKKLAVEKVYWWFPWINAVIGSIFFFYVLSRLIE